MHTEISYLQALNKSIGNVVQQRRLRLGLSQEKLAAKAALHRTYITDVEGGRRNLSLQTLVRIAHALDIRTSHLLQLGERDLVEYQNHSEE